MVWGLGGRRTVQFVSPFLLIPVYTISYLLSWVLMFLVGGTLYIVWPSITPSCGGRAVVHWPMCSFLISSCPNSHSLSGLRIWFFVSVTWDGFTPACSVSWEFPTVRIFWS
jgi:hypothetical protein